MWSKQLTIVLVLVVLFSSCATKKKTVSPQETTKTITINDGYSISNLDFRTFSGKAKTKLELGEDKQDVTLHVRVDRDKAIWISVTATLVNYEAARVLITPDSIKIMNKMQSEYIAKPFTYIHKFTGPGVSFSLVQDLLMANVNRSLLRTEQMTIASADQDIQLVGINDGLAFQYSLNENKRPKVFTIQAVGANENLAAYYSSFAAVTGYNFPQNQRISINMADLVINALLNYTKLDFNEPVEMPFTVPVKYREIN